MATRLHEMTMSQPATCWQDALPTGNGTVGAMMYGQICNEQILLNHEALWYHEARPEMCLTCRGKVGSGSVEGIVSGEILVTEIVGNRFMIDVPCMYVETVSEVRIPQQRIAPA